MNAHSKRCPLPVLRDILPFAGEKGEWTARHSKRLEEAAMVMKDCNEIASIIDSMKFKTLRNRYRLEVYEQVNELVRFPGMVLFALQAYDIAQPGREEQEALEVIQMLRLDFNSIRSELERVYGQTRILDKPPGYLLDQDHHHHLANQSVNFDWQFGAELAFLKKLEVQINTLQK